MEAQSNKRIAKNTLFLYFRMFFMMAISLYTSRIILNTLGVLDYGINNVVGGVVVLFSFFNSAMSVSTQRFLSYDLGRGDVRELQKTFNVAVQLHLAMAILIVLLIETVGLWFVVHYIVVPVGREDTVMWVYQLAMLGFIFGILQVPFMALIIANERMSVFAYLSIVDAVLKLGVAFLLEMIDTDKLKLFVVLQCSVSVIVAFVYVIYARVHFGKVCRFNLFRFYPERFREMAGYAGWNSSSQIAILGRTQGVNILVNLFFGPAMNTARAVSVQINSAIFSFVSNFQMAMNPQIVKRYAAKDFESMERLLVRGAKYSFFLLFAISCPALIEMERLLQLWLGTPPDYSLLFCRLALIGALADTLSVNLSYGILATGKVKNYQLAIGLVVLSVPCLTYACYKLGLPVEYCFYVEILSYILSLVVRILFLKRLVPFSIKEFLVSAPLRCLCVVAMALPLPMVVHEYCEVLSPWGALVTVTFSSLISVGIVIAMVGLNAQERTWILLRLRKKWESIKKER